MKSYGKNKKTKPKYFVLTNNNQAERITETINAFKEKFPHIFGPTAIKPLKCKIHIDLHEVFKDAGFSMTMIRQALFFHTRTVGYVKSVVDHNYRFNLEEQPVDEVEASHKKDAFFALKRFINMQKKPPKKKFVKRSSAPKLKPYQSTFLEKL